jgi:hypothetical protein
VESGSDWGSRRGRYLANEVFEGQSLFSSEYCEVTGADDQVYFEDKKLR